MSEKPLADGLRHLVETYGRIPLNELAKDEKFQRDALMNGRNIVNRLVRRYSFRNSSVEIEVPEVGVVLIKERYGYDGLKTIYTVERNVKHIPADAPVTVFASSPEVTLGELEEAIASEINIGAWSMPETMRNIPIGYYLTPESPYVASFQFLMDTLSIFAQFTVVVMLDYINITDAVKQLSALYHKQTGVVLPDVFDIRKNCQNDYTIAQQYRSHLDSGGHANG